MTVRVMIADDEALARTRLRRLVELEVDAEVVAEAASTADAVRLLGTSRPHVLFLDIRMPGEGGFAVLDALADPPPAVVFVTAYEDHAVRAFEVDAADYLLKPFDTERFHAAFARARRYLERRSAAPRVERLRSLLKRLESAPAVLAADSDARLPVRDGARITFVRVADIDWIQGAGNYARLHAGRAVHLARVPLAELERRLGPRGFARIHRSTIVNLARVREMRHWSGGTHLLVLADGTELRVSPGYKDALLARFE